MEPIAVQEPQPNYYAVIPSEIRYNKNLNESAKLLYGEIAALSNKTGICWAGNKYFSDLFDKDDRTIRRILQDLVGAGYITIEHPTSTTRNIKLTVQYTNPKSAGQICPPDGQICPPDGQICPPDGHKCPPCRTNMSATPDINVRHNNITNNITNNNNINNKEEKENYIKEKESWSLADSVDYFFKTIPVERTEYLGRAVERIGSERIKNGASAWDLRRAVDGFNNADVADTRWYKAKKLFTPNHIWGFAESGRDNMRHWIDKLEVYELRMARYNALPTFGGSKADGC